MKRILFAIMALAAAVACTEESLPKDPVVRSDIGCLVVTVSGTDYTAVPVMGADKTLTDSLLLSVTIPSATATVKSISLADASASVSIAEGQEISFVGDVCPIEYTGRDGTRTYLLVMSYNPPPFMYIVRSGDRDASGDRYWLDTGKAPRIVSMTYDSAFEGYVDLSSNNWDNLCLVQSDQSVYYDVAEGFTANQTYGTLTLQAKTPQGDGHFSSSGPWGNWTTTAGNTSIVSPGIWKINFDADTKDLVMLETQWAVSGSAVAATSALTYDSAAKVWSAVLPLSQGSLRFTTIPVNPSDPVVEYGGESGGRVSSRGTDLTVDEPGTYEVTLDLDNGGQYTYSLVRQ